MDLTKRRGLANDPEPRRDLRDRRERGDRDRGDRGGRGRDRDRAGEHAPVAPSAAPPEAAGPAIQTPPPDLPRPAVRPATPILPPLMSPQQLSWKQEVRQEPQPSAEKPPEGEKQ